MAMENKEWSIPSQLMKAKTRYGHSYKQIAEAIGLSEPITYNIIAKSGSKAKTEAAMSAIRTYINHGIKPKPNTIETHFLDVKLPEIEANKQLVHTPLKNSVTRSTYTKEAIEFTMKKWVKKEVKPGQFEIVGCLVAILINPTISNPVIEDAPYFVSIGLSMCNIKHDKFDKQLGEKIAIGRAKAHHNIYTFRNVRLDAYYHGYTLYDEVDNFIQRCVRYYKNKSIIHPKIVLV